MTMLTERTRSRSRSLSRKPRYDRYQEEIYINNLIKRLKKTEYDPTEHEYDSLRNYYNKYPKDEETREKILSVFAQSEPFLKLLSEFITGNKNSQNLLYRRTKSIFGLGKKKKTIRKKKGKRKKKSKKKK